jgi:hypothetical protein
VHQQVRRAVTVDVAEGQDPLRRLADQAAADPLAVEAVGRERAVRRADDDLRLNIKQSCNDCHRAWRN